MFSCQFTAESQRTQKAENNLTQEKLAQSVGVSRQAINAIETGKYDPSLPLAIKLGKLFGKPVEEIFLVDEETEAN
jgi:putative transcriptional regulator